MTFAQAKKLHSGDEMEAKNNGEIVIVLDVEILPYGNGTNERKGTPIVRIEGLGDNSGYGHWDHDEVS